VRFNRAGDLVWISHLRGARDGADDEGRRGDRAGLARSDER
jgi:hypothetical protein